MLQLWDAKGEKWAKNFLTRLHDDVKAQLRKEGENASLRLVGAGEYDGILVSSEYRTHELRKKGAPVAFHCPSPVPVAVSPMGVFRGSPGQYGAMIFVNWVISKEGQIVNFAVSGQVPTHKDLQGKEFLFFPDEFAGKASAFPTQLDDENQEKLQEFWTNLWGEAK
jgi:ABC-type Fe3+ transport system substrate-binding protein